jgi:hypothetical protein
VGNWGKSHICIWLSPFPNPRSYFTKQGKNGFSPTTTPPQPTNNQKNMTSRYDIQAATVATIEAAAKLTSATHKLFDQERFLRMHKTKMPQSSLDQMATYDTEATELIEAARKALADAAQLIERATK